MKPGSDTSGWPPRTSPHCPWTTAGCRAWPPAPWSVPTWATIGGRLCCTACSPPTATSSCSPTVVHGVPSPTTSDSSLPHSTASMRPRLTSLRPPKPTNAWSLPRGWPVPAANGPPCCGGAVSQATPSEPATFLARHWPPPENSDLRASSGGPSKSSVTGTTDAASRRRQIQPEQVFSVTSVMSRAAVNVSRRRFLGFLVVGGPTLAIGARLGLDGAFGNGVSGAEVGFPEVNDVADL